MALASARRLAPVRVAADRVIRVIVGLRPIRPSGFVVRGEKLGEKTVIHNYGNSGAGIPLSWGTAQLAVEEAAKTEIRDCAVIGCGVVVQYTKGRASRRLQEEFQELRKRYWGQHLWARGYFCASVGAVDEATIRSYIENQRWDEDDQGFKITVPSEP